MRQGGEAFLRGRIFVEEDPGDDVYHMVFSFHEAWQGIVVVEVGVQVFYEAAVTEAAQKEDEAPFTLPEVVCAVDFFCNVPVMWQTVHEIFSFIYRIKRGPMGGPGIGCA